MVVSLGACGGKKTGDGSSKTYKVGVIQLIEHESLDAATKGFKDELKKKFGDRVQIEVKNAQGEAATNATIANGYVSDGKDLILANGTASLQAAMSATGDIPVLGTAITDYGTVLNTKNFKGTTGINVSGTSDLAPIDQLEDIMRTIVPKAKKIGIIYCSAEPNSKYQVKQMEAELQKDGLSYKEYTVADANDVQSVATKACQESDALYVPTDNVMAANATVLKNVVVPAKKPLFAGDKGICSAGVATLSIDYYKLGQLTAYQAHEILVNKKDVKSMKIASDTAPKKLYNAEICKAIGIKIPKGFTPLK